MQLGTRPPGSPAPTNEGAHDSPTPVIDSSAIGWSLTGTMNAPKNASLAVLYPPNTRDVHTPKPRTANLNHPSMISNPPPPHASKIPLFPRPGTELPSPPTNFPPNFNAAPQPVDPSRIQDADLLLSLTHSPYNQSSPQQLPNPGIPPPPNHLTNPQQSQQQHQQNPNSMYLEHSQQQQNILNQATLSQQQQQQQEYQRMQEQSGMQNYNNMIIESQDLDMSTVLGDDLKWLEYLPSEPLGGYYGAGDHGV